VTFEGFRLLYVLACVGLGLVILSPTLAFVVTAPSEVRFSEMWILGSGRLIGKYPFNVTMNEVYKVYLGVGNRMGEFEYYRVYVKLRNQTEPLPDALNGTPSVLESVFEYNVFLSSKTVWEKEISFYFEEIAFDGNNCRISKLVMDDCALKVDKVGGWDEESQGFHFELFFELWLYDAAVSRFQYHSRFVGFLMNVTRNQ